MHSCQRRGFHTSLFVINDSRIGTQLSGKDSGWQSEHTVGVQKRFDQRSLSDKGGSEMSQTTLIKNMSFSEPHVLTDLVDYEEGRVVSRTFAQNRAISVTLFAFDRGEGLSTHTAAGDALVQVLDGEASIVIGGKQVLVKQGEAVAMPANVPHALHANQPFKMLLTVVKPVDPDVASGHE